MTDHKNVAKCKNCLTIKIETETDLGKPKLKVGISG
jgi:hypothetical protein